MAYTTINKSSEHFNTVTYTGDGTSDRAVTSGFATDFVWIKNRNTTDDHVIFDKVRGGTKYLYTNATQAESTYSSLDLTFESTGVDVGSYTTINNNGSNIVSWHWKANGTGSANTDGSISSTVSVNTTAGFSIVTVSKPNTSVATIGHGLGVTPKFIIGKDLDGVDNWTCYNEALGNGKGIYLNATNAEATASTFWNSTSPTSSVFTIGSDNTWNSPSMVFYCFADVQGYSKFGSYVGNGSGDGTFVYTGFKPAFAILKCTNTARSWQIHNNKLNPFNSCTSRLFPNLSDAEATGTEQFVDFLSNGFKLKSNDANGNGTGNSYIYMAFAEAPLVGTNNVPCTAR